jgi:RNA polymerase sigma-70 factor (ECF subfamily)
LIAAAQAGDRDALDTLLRRHYDRLYALCRRLAGNDADALDATQEALIAIVRGLPRFDGRARFATWAYRVATNACLDELRRRKRRPQLGLSDDDIGERPGRSAPIADSVADRLDVDAALAQLTPEYRAAVVLRDLCTLDYAEIADVLEIPIGTVRSRIARGRAQLADLLSGNPEPGPPRPSTQP